MDVKKTISNIVKAAVRGELLLRLRVDKLFVYILYFFVIVWLYIFADLQIGQTLVRLEKNRRQIEELKIYHAQKTSQLATFDRISTIEAMLEQSGSDVRMSENPPARIK